MVVDYSVGKTYVGLLYGNGLFNMYSCIKRV